MPASTVPTASAPGRRAVWLVVLLVVAAWVAGAVWPRLLVVIGISDYGRPYLDSYAVLAALDAVRAGADPYAANPLDALMRPHVYSDWWLALRWLGLTREHNFLLGTLWAAAFGAMVWLQARPARVRDALWTAALLVSPSVMLAVNRANNDLVIFLLLGGMALVATGLAWWRVSVAVAGLGLAAGLKYFPAPAALALLWIRPVRRMPAVLLLGLLAAMLALAAVWPDIERGRFHIASGIYTMGAPLWWRDFGWKDQASALPSLVVIVLAAAGLALTRVTTGLTTRGRPQERMLAAVGAIVLLTCFLAGVNYAYRWIFVLWPALWLWREAGAVEAPVRARLAARVACGLIVACLWLDGLLCTAVNLHLKQYAQVWVSQFDVTWRQWTQPLHWALMMMLAGWLLEAGLTTVKEWWRARHEP
jgi:hypothetical protein